MTKQDATMYMSRPYDIQPSGCRTRQFGLNINFLLKGFSRVKDVSQVFSCPSGNVMKMQFGVDGSLVKLITDNVSFGLV